MLDNRLLSEDFAQRLYSQLIEAQDEAIAPILRKFRPVYTPATAKLTLETENPRLQTALEAQAGYLKIPASLKGITIETSNSRGERRSLFSAH